VRRVGRERRAEGGRDKHVEWVPRELESSSGRGTVGVLVGLSTSSANFHNHCLVLGPDLDTTRETETEKVREVKRERETGQERDRETEVRQR
jgi:hypothetical protein